jgi:REP element-mobilizing transposase RayT
MKTDSHSSPNRQAHLTPPRRRYNRSLRLRGFNYASSRWYFVTICTHGRKCNLSRIEACEVVLSKFGRIAVEKMDETKAKRPYLVLGPWVVMPNHIHALLGLAATTHLDPTAPERSLPETPPEFQHLTSDSLSSVVGAFKSAVTKEVNRLRGTPGADYWQQGFWEHIVRDDREWEEIANYILWNPVNWGVDPDNPDSAPNDEDVRRWKYLRDL